MRVGRDHIGSTVNTLVLAYAGASLPLLLLFTQTSQSLGNVLNGEVVASEVIRTLVGSLGLVASVPITTALAVWVVRSQVPGALATDATPVLGTEPAPHPDLESEEHRSGAIPSPEPESADLESEEHRSGAIPSPEPEVEVEPEPVVPPSWDDFAPDEDPDLP